MNNSQETICKIILEMLKIEEFRKNGNAIGYTKIMGEAIRHYAEDNNKYENTYQKIDLCKRHHKFTERAVKAFKNVKDIKDVWDVLHYEHIVPVKVLKDKLLAIKESELSLDKVCEIMKDDEVIILSKEEADVLNGKISTQYELDNKKINGKGMKCKGTRSERLNIIGAKIHEDYENNEIDS